MSEPPDGFASDGEGDRPIPLIPDEFEVLYEGKELSAVAHGPRAAAPAGDAAACAAAPATDGALPVWTAEGHKVFMEHNTLQEAHAAHIAAKGIDESKLNPAQKKQLDTSVKKAYEQAEKDARKEYEESLWVPLNEAGDLPPGPPGFKSQLTDEERAKWRRGEFEGGPNVDIMQRFKPHTDPYDFYRLFLPAELVKEEVKHTNAYAVYQSAGTDVYMPKHVPFFTDELEKGEGLLLRNGIHPLPDLNFMFTDTRKDWARPRPGARAAMAPTPVRAAHARRCSTSPA